MAQIGRNLKNLEPPRPLKQTLRQSHHTPQYEVESLEELITLTENVAESVSSGHCNLENINILTANLRVLGPQLEMLSKDTLDRAFVQYRNASQDERLGIIARMAFLELIELRAKSWQNSDGTNTYYKHKATDVQQPDSTSFMNDVQLLSTSPPIMSLGQSTQALGPGELINPSGKFHKPTKIPGKNYFKDEVVIRNADSGKVNPGAKERLVQITGPSEDKINYSKQLIEETIRRNASPVRLDAPQEGSCSSLASSISDETVPRVNRNSIGAMMGSAGIAVQNNFMMPNPYQMQNFTGNTGSLTNTSAGGLMSGIGANITNKLKRTTVAGNGGQLLLHSLSTNDATLGEYKYTVNVGNYSLKVTGERIELVMVAKLVLDDYFSSNEFLAPVEASVSLESPSIVPPTNQTNFSQQVSTIPSIPTSHQLASSSPFADSGIGLNMMTSSVGCCQSNNNSHEVDDDVFIVEPEPSVTTTTISSNSTINPNGLTRSRRSHFSRKENTPELIKEPVKESTPRITYEYESMIYYAKSPHSMAVPREWAKICEKHPGIVRKEGENCFDADKYLALIKAGKPKKFIPSRSESSQSPEPDKS